MVATRGVPRKPLLLAGITGFIVANAVTAVSASYELTLVGRAVAGACSGLLWGLAPGYARRIVPPDRAGRGLAVAGVGTPLALAIGTPVGSFAGQLVGWRWIFGTMSLAGLALVVWVLVAVPAAGAGEYDERKPTRVVASVLTRPGVRPVLAVVGIWMLGHNLLTPTWRRSWLRRPPQCGSTSSCSCSGSQRWSASGVTGTLVDAALRRLTIFSLSAFSGMAVLLTAVGGTAAALAAALVWGLTFGGASALLNTAVADAAEPETDIAATLVSTVWNAAIFGGSALGALLLGLGARYLPGVVLPLGLAALVVVIVARRHAFRAGRRGSA